VRSRSSSPSQAPCRLARPARAHTRPGFYLGVGGGSSHLELGDEQLRVEANDIGYQVFAGCNFSRYFAPEAAGLDAGVPTIDPSDGAFFMRGVSGLYRF
jgi:hypothetical protein